ncbi:MAG: EAL domain-containing protein [Spirochaetes bacterium]|nr:EAL domain-containing protein [Spirochaetota bacterium]MBU1081191.1 EAL domain-containing protein [Spirochaetota bacterium]
MSKHHGIGIEGRSRRGSRHLGSTAAAGPFGFDWKKARLDIETETRRYQKSAAIFAYLIGALFPIAFLVDDLLSGRPPAYANYIVPLVALIGIALWQRASNSRRPMQIAVVGSLILGFLLTLFLPFSRNAYIVIYFCFPSLTLLVLGPGRGLAASAAFFLLATALGVLYLRGYVTGTASPFNSSMFAMASVAFAFQCTMGVVSEWRHARNVDRLVERRFFDPETLLPNSSAFSMERLVAGESLVLVHFANLRDLRAIAGREEVGTLSSKAALGLLESRSASIGRRGPFRVSDTDFCFVFPAGDSVSEEADAIHADFSELPAVKGSPLRFVTRIASFRVETETSAPEALDETVAALSDCIAGRAASLHRCESAIANDKDALRSRAPNLLRNIERGLFMPVFQPVYDLERDGIGFLEALIRLDEGGSSASPERYLDAAFRLGLDRYLTEFILERALGMALESGHSVSFNATFRDIVRPAFRAGLAGAYGALSGRDNTIIVEITEQAAVEDTSILKEFVGEVHGLGGLVFLDDFGSGYSNYSRLLESSFDAVKAAGEIVREIEARPEAYTLYRGMAAFCAEAGLSVVAEHISGSGIMQRAISGGARYLQGYLLSPPLSAGAVLENDFAFPGGLSTASKPLGAGRPALGAVGQ